MKCKLWIVPALIVIAILAVALLAQVQGQASQNPLAQFVHNGKITIPGGALTKELQQLLFPPPPPKNYTTYAMVDSSYPTLEWVGTVHEIPQAGQSPPGPAQSIRSFGDAIARWFGPMPDWGAVWSNVRAGAAWLLFGWWSGAASATTFTASQTGNWDDTATWGGTGPPGTGDVANINGKTVTIRTSVTVFQIDSTAADSLLVIDTTINGAAITLTFNDTAGAGFTGSAGGRQRDEIKIVGTSTNGVTIQSANAPPTNRWGQSGTTWGVNSGGWSYATIIDFSDGGFSPQIAPGQSTPGWRTLDHVTFKSNTTSEHVTFGSDVTTPVYIRGVSIVFDRILFGNVGAGQTNGISFIDTATVLNGGSFVPGASAQPAMLALKTYLGTANDYRIFWGNGLSTTTGLAALQSGDRPGSSDNLTWGGIPSAEKGTWDVAISVATLSLASSAQLDINTGGSPTVTGTVTLGTNAFVTGTAGGPVSMGAVTFAAGNYISLGSLSWTFTGTWTNGSTSASWSAGSGTVTFADASSATMTFAGANLSGNEFNNVVFDTPTAAGVTYTMSTRAIKAGGTLTVQNTAGSASGAVILSTSTSNLAVTAAGVALGTLGAISANGSSVTVNGNVSVSAASAYMVLGASSWTVTGTWSNSSTSSSWNPGTSTVAFTSASSISVSEDLSLPVNEWFNVTFQSSNAGAPVTFTFTTALVIAGTFKVQGQNVTGTTQVVVATITVGTVSLQDWGIGNPGSATGYWKTANWVDTANSTYSRYAPNGTATCPTSGSSCVEFNASGTFSTVNGWNLINVQVDVGVTTTTLTQVTVTGVLTVNGTWVAGSPNDPQLVTLVTDTYGASGSSGLILGTGANMSQSGYFVLSSNGPATWSVPGGLYQHLGIRPNPAQTVNILGDLSTPLCGVFNACSIILYDTAGSSSLPTINSNGYSLTAGGVLWIGDGGTTGVIFNASTSTLTGYGVSVNANSIANFQNSTVIAHPSPATDPIAFYVVDSGTVNLGSATINSHGELRLFAGATVLNGQNGTVNVLTGEGTCNLMYAGCPGQVIIASAAAYIDFGSSTWNVQAGWQNLSTSASWNATSTATINFTGPNPTFLPAGSALPGAEFPNMVVPAGSSITVPVATQLKFRGLTISGALTINGAAVGTAGYSIAILASSGYATLTTWNVWAPSGVNIVFPVTLSDAGASLTVTVTGIATALSAYKDGVLAGRSTQSGETQVMQIPGPWSPHEIAITSGSGPGGGGAGGNPPMPTIDATASSDGMTYTFALVLPTGYTLSSATWDFGDGGTASGQEVTHTFAYIGIYTVRAQVKFTTGYATPITTTVAPLGPANQIPDWVPLLIVMAALVALVLVLVSESENRKVWMAVVSLAVFWAAIAYVAVAQFPTLVPRELFIHFPLAVGAVAALMAMEKENKKKLVWIGIIVTAIVVWWITVVA